MARGASMNIDEKFEHMKRALRLGMDTTAAAIVAGISASELEELEERPDFKARVEFTRREHERVLLERMERIAEANEHIGTSTETRWLLERINPTRWGNRGSGKEVPHLRIIEFLGPDNDYEEEDNARKSGVVGCSGDDADFDSVARCAERDFMQSGKGKPQSEKNKPQRAVDVDE